MQRLSTFFKGFLAGIFRELIAEVMESEIKRLEHRLIGELAFYRSQLAQLEQYPDKLKDKILDELEVRLQRVLEKSISTLPVPKPKFSFFGGSSDG